MPNPRRTPHPTFYFPNWVTSLKTEFQPDRWRLFCVQCMPGWLMIGQQFMDIKWEIGHLHVDYSADYAHTTTVSLLRRSHSDP
jgi:hypothetical protein